MEEAMADNASDVDKTIAWTLHYVATTKGKWRNHLLSKSKFK